MGRQIIILGASGSFNIDNAVQLTQLACTLGLQVLHASIFYDGDGRQHFAVGGPSDLSADLARLGGGAVQFVPADQPLSEEAEEEETDLSRLEEVMTILRRIDQNTTPQTPPKKKKGAADQGGNVPLNQAGAGGDTGGTHESGTGTGGTAPAGAPVGPDGKPPEAGDVPAGAAGSEEKAPGAEDGAQKEGGGDQQQTGTEG